jgi:hypothetical protein
MLGPIFGGWGFALALNLKFVAMPFWAAMILSGLACLLSLAVFEGDGHEIKLDGDEAMEDMTEIKDKVEKTDVELANGAVERREHSSASGNRSD